MNKKRRKIIERILVNLEEAASELESQRDDEQEYYDNMPESFQSGEKGEKVDSGLASLNDLIDNIESGIADIRETCEI